MLDDERSSSPLTTPNPVSLHSLPRSEHSTPTKMRRSYAPKTPTPFKKALAELEKQGGVVKCLTVRTWIIYLYKNTIHCYFIQPPTPGCLDEDISDMIKKEQDPTDSNYETDHSYIVSTSQGCMDSGYQSKRKQLIGKENAQPHKKARKSLMLSMSTDGEDDYLAETPVSNFGSNRLTCTYKAWTFTRV